MSLDEHKICFITCVNNECYEREEMKYLNSLIVPAGYEVEMLSIKDAVSMAAGYNEGMQASNAKYKVYLHQDVFVVNQHFIRDILEVFRNPEIGILGMVGSPELPENGIMWDGPRIGKLYYSVIYHSSNSVFGEIDGEWQSVEALDGLLMATQYDIPWREDLFHKWDFYDISQCQEFIKNNYKVVVPNQKKPWCIHDDGFSNYINYYEERKIFLREYKGYGKESIPS